MVDDASMIKNAVEGAPGGAPPGMPPSAMPPVGQGPPLGGAPDMGMMEPDSGQELSNLDRRMRVLEERFTNLRKRTQVEEQNNIRSSKKLRVEIRATEEQIRDLRVDITDLKNKFKILINELKLYSTKEEMKVLEKYVNMWEPVTFVTRREVEGMIRRIVEDEYHLKGKDGKGGTSPKRNVHIR